MGQAKRRGTFEHRKSSAIERHRLEEVARKEAYYARISAMVLAREAERERKRQINAYKVMGGALLAVDIEFDQPNS
mgnify:CR=1 FL=1